MEFSRKDSLLRHKRNRHETNVVSTEQWCISTEQSSISTTTDTTIITDTTTTTADTSTTTTTDTTTTTTETTNTAWWTPNIQKIEEFSWRRNKRNVLSIRVAKSIYFSDDDIWKIEKILKTKGTGNNKHYFIKWLHWPKKFNSWIFARDVNNLWFYYQWEWTIPERLTFKSRQLTPLHER